MTREHKQAGGIALTEKIREIIRNIGIPGASNIHVALGPVVHEDDGAPGWYFMTVAGDDGHISRIDFGGDKGLAEEARLLMWQILAIDFTPIVVHDFDDELEMAKWSHAIWPARGFDRIRESIERERSEDEHVGWTGCF